MEISSMSNEICLSDEMGTLKMYCYSRFLDMEEVDSATAECRGVVFNENETVVSKAFGYTPVYSTQPCANYKTLPENLKEYLTTNFKECTFYDSYEGALVRAFYYQGKWYLTTHRKLDAFKSYWGCRTSFGEMFKNALVELNGSLDGTNADTIVEDFLESLNKEKQYVFLLVSTLENRIACTPPNVPTVKHVGTFENGVLVPNPSTQVPIQEPLHFDNLDKVLEYTKFTFPTKQGIVVFMPNGKQIKLCHPDYLNLFNLRGNEASVMFRYLQVRSDPIICQQYITLYPEHKTRFDHYEDVLEKVSHKIYESYRDRFVHKKYVLLPQEEYTVMSAVHRWYKSKRDKIKVHQFDVLRILNEAPPPSLNVMIRRYDKNLKDIKKMEETPETHETYEENTE
jgi:hypothetical protein